MSWEAWGTDEPPTDWEETDTHQEFAKLQAAFVKYRVEHSDKFGEEGRAVLNRIDTDLDVFKLGWLTGAIDA